jgi:hypothetical protein
VWGWGAAPGVGACAAGLLLAGGGFGLLGLVAAAPCLLILAAVAIASNRHPASIPGAGSERGEATRLSVKAMPH